MELTSNAFYYCTPGCKRVAEELREQERTEEKKKLKKLDQSEKKHRNNGSGPHLTSVIPPPFIFLG